MARTLVRLHCAVRRHLEADRGATAVEYGLMVGLIAVAMMVAVIALGTNMSRMFSTVASSL